MPLEQDLQAWSKDKTSEFFQKPESIGSLQEYLRTKQIEGTPEYTDEQIAEFSEKPSVYDAVADAAPKDITDKAISFFAPYVANNTDYQDSADNKIFLETVLDQASTAERKIIKRALEERGVSTPAQLFREYHQSRDRWTQGYLTPQDKIQQGEEESRGLFGFAKDLGAGLAGKDSDTTGGRLASALKRSARSQTAQDATGRLIEGLQQIQYDDPESVAFGEVEAPSRDISEKFDVEAANDLAAAIKLTDEIPMDRSITNVMTDGTTISKAIDSLGENKDALVYLMAEGGVDLVEEAGAQVAGSIVGGVAGGASTFGAGTGVGAVAGGAAAAAAAVKNNTRRDFYKSEVQNYLKKQNIEASAENILAFRRNSELHDAALKKADKFSSIIAAGAAASGFIGGAQVFSGMVRSALRAGMQPTIKGSEVIWKQPAIIAAQAVGAAGAGVGAEFTAAEAVGQEQTPAELVVSGAANIAGAGLDVGIGVMSNSNNGRLPSVTVNGRKLGRPKPEHMRAAQEAGYLDAIAIAEKKNGLEPGVLYGLIEQESMFRPDVIHGKTKSRVGATGIAQFMPATAKDFNLDPTDPFASIEAGAKYLAQLKKATGSTQDALTAYNFGLGNLRKLQKGERTQPTESKRYAPEALARARFYAGTDSVVNARADAPLPYNPRNIEDRNNPKYRLVDNYEQATERNRQRTAMATEPGFRAAWDTDTRGRGNEKSYRKGIDAFTQSRLDGNDLQSSYRKAATAIGSDSRARDFVSRLRGLSDDVPVIDDSTVGQTGLSQRALIDAVEDFDSPFYASFESEANKRLLQKAVRSGDRRGTIDLIRREAAQATDVEKAKAYTAVAEQFVYPAAARIENVKDAARTYQASDEGLSSKYFSGESQAAFDGSLDSALQVLNNSHRDYLRNHIGDIKRAKTTIGDAPDADVLARSAVDILDSSQTSSEAAFRLAQTNNESLQRLASKIINDRKNTEKLIGTSVFSQRLKSVQDNPQESIKSEGINQSILTGEPDAIAYTPNRSKLQKARDVSRGFLRANFTQKFGLPENVAESEFTNVRGLAVDAGNLAKNRVEYALNEMGRTISPEESAQLNQFLRGEVFEIDEDLRPLADSMRQTVDSASLKIADKLADSSGILNQLGVENTVDDEIGVLIQNLNAYMNTSYDAFENTSAWKQAIDNGDLYARAVDEAKASGVENPERTVQGVVDNILEDNDQVGFYSNYVAENDVLKSRTDVPSWMKTLLGIREDASDNYAMTTRRQTALYRKIGVDNNVVNNLAEAGLISGQPVRGWSKIDKNSPLYNKFSAMQNVYVEPETYNNLLSIRNVKKDKPPKELNTLNQISFLLKANWTAFNVKSHFTQWLGATTMGAMHLPLNPVKWKQIASNIKKERDLHKQGKQSDIRDAAIKYGILDSADAADLMGVLGSGSGLIKGTAKKAADKIIDVYGTPDKAVKYMVFLDRVEAERKAVQYDVDNGVSDLTPDEIESAAIKNAAEFAATALPTPARSIGAVKKIRAPQSVKELLGNFAATPFLTFAVGMPISLKNTGVYIAKNIKSDNPHRKNHALKLLSTIGIVSAYYMTDADLHQQDEFYVDENQELMPPYYRGQEVKDAHYDESGNLRFSVTEFTNPISFFTGPGRALLNPNLSVEEKSAYVSQWARQAYLGGSPVSKGLEAISSVINPDPFNPITLDEKINKLSAWNVNPTVQHLKKIYDEYNKIDTEGKADSIDNILAASYRADYKQVDPVDMWSNVGKVIASAGKSDAANFIKSMKSLDKNDIEQTKDAAKYYLSEKQQKLDKLWQVLPKLDSHLNSIQDKITSKQLGLMVQRIASSSGVTQDVFKKNLKDYRANLEKPTLKASGFISKGVDVTRRAFFENYDAKRNKKERDYILRKQRLVNEILNQL